MIEFDVRIGKHTDILPLTKKKVITKLVCDNHLSTCDDFSVLNNGSKNILHELKEVQLILRDQTSLNKNITSTSSYSFDKPW